MKLKDKVALVTGASSGIGRAIAMAFSREGAKVTVNGRNTERVNKVVGEIEKLGAEALGVPADVAQPQEVKEMFSRVLDRFGTLDILVNNAGDTMVTDEVIERFDKRIEQVATTGATKMSLEATRRMTDEAWSRTLEVHLFGTFYCTREALNIMEDKGYGKIINIASVAGIVGGTGIPNYSAAKGGIIGFTKSVAKEVIPRGVYINAIAPGWVETPMLDILTPRMRAFVIAETPLGRTGTPEEIASVAVFLASEESSFIVGQVICPAGGGYV